MSKIAIIGFGEAGQAFAKGWENFHISAYDIKTESSNADDKWADYERAGVTGCKTIQEALKDAGVIFSLVTADQANTAAICAAKHLASKTLFFDGNSCAPDTKKKSADVINNADGRYIDMAIMAPVYLALNKTPVLLSGEYVEAAKDWVKKLQMSSKRIEGPVGTASAIKMTRSVMMKGLEALMLECVLAGRKAGVDDIVLNSLEETYPGFEWKKRAAYMFERVMTHGVRRAAEMREVAIAVDDLGLNGTMAQASVDWQQRIGDLDLDTAGYEYKSYQQLADILLSQLEGK